MLDMVIRTHACEASRTTQCMGVVHEAAVRRMARGLRVKARGVLSQRGAGCLDVHQGGAR